MTKPLPELGTILSVWALINVNATFHTWRGDAMLSAAPLPMAVAHKLVGAANIVFPV